MTVDRPDDDPDAWMLRAKCKGLPLDLFFPEGRGGTLAPVYAICWGRDGRPECPVRLACKNHAILNNETGVWGGEYFSPRYPGARTVNPVVPVVVVPRAERA